MNRRNFLKASLLSWPLLGEGLAIAASDSIVIGQSCALSGPIAILGQDFQIGAKLWFDAINKKGGIRGQRIELITLDDGYEPERAAKNTEQLINKNNALALFGYVGTPTSDAARPIFERNNVPFVAPFTGAQSLRTPQSSLIYNIRASYEDETERLVKHFASIGQKRISVAYQNDSFGAAGLEGVEKAARSYGATIVARTTLARNSSDVPTAANALLRGGAADALIIISTYAPTAALIKSLRKSSYPVTYATLSAVGITTLQEMLGNDADGVVVSQVVPWGADPVVTEFKKLLSQEYPGRQPSHTALEGFIGAKSLELALQRSKSLTRSELNSTLSQTKADLGGFKVDFTSKRHSGQFTDVVMLKKSGSLVS